MSSQYCLRQTGGHRNQSLDNNKYDGCCCGDMRVQGRKQRNQNRQLPFRNISWGREQLGQYGSLVQCRPEEQSLHAHTAALDGKCGRPVRQQANREVQWASSTLARKRNKGRHYASSHRYSLIHTSTHTLHSVKLLRLKPGRGRERESSPEGLLEESWASFLSRWIKHHVCVSVYVYEDV